MPVVAKLMEALQQRYGPSQGERVYYAMEAEGKGPFSPGGKYRNLHEKFAAKHGLTPSAATRSRPKNRKARR